MSGAENKAVFLSYASLLITLLIPARISDQGVA